MISVSNITVASDYVASRARKMLCRNVAPFEWKVTPLDGKEHTIKRVRFVKRARGYTVECESFYDAVPCEANSFGNLCAHVWRTVEQLRINEIRRQRREERQAA
ncbi:MAG TPA: hypothetical protein VIX17_11715 [Pyrinomonadaceae bacterium]|jgi:hypothetical protein